MYSRTQNRINIIPFSLAVRRGLSEEVTFNCVNSRKITGKIILGTQNNENSKVEMSLTCLRNGKASVYKAWSAKCECYK